MDQNVDTKQSMDMAAEEAKSELLDLIEEKRISKTDVQAIGLWIKKNYMKAGYKRLAKIIREV